MVSTIHQGIQSVDTAIAIYLHLTLNGELAYAASGR